MLHTERFTGDASSLFCGEYGTVFLTNSRMVCISALRSCMCIDPQQPRRQIMTRRVYVLFLVVPLLAIFSMSPAFAETMMVKGKIMGASCVINETVCATSFKDPRVFMERDFVLVSDDGSTYFLPNMTRVAKQKLVSEEVEVVGKVNGDRLFVHNVDKMMMGGMVSVWNWDLRVRNLRHPR